MPRNINAATVRTTVSPVAAPDRGGERHARDSQRLETRAGLMQYPGALTLNFGPITNNGVSFVPVGIWARYMTNSFDIT